ncbi:MAG: hypothetical protein NT076_00280 [Candidatus Pacearchaeota archaeon]|nr:hypothetical protein [Candidatus Pacearchaeota archaeon]
MKCDKVIFIEESLEKSFNELSEEDSIKKAIKRAIQTIYEDFSCGRNIKKSLIPMSLINKYDINNLWIYNLPNSWRLLYSVTSSAEVEIIAVLLNWMDHKDYEKLFNF